MSHLSNFNPVFHALKRSTPEVFFLDPDTLSRETYELSAVVQFVNFKTLSYLQQFNTFCHYNIEILQDLFTIGFSGKTSRGPNIYGPPCTRIIDFNKRCSFCLTENVMEMLQSPLFSSVSNFPLVM